MPEIPDVENYSSEFESCLSLIGKCIFVQNPIHAVKKSWEKDLVLDDHFLFEVIIGFVFDPEMLTRNSF